MTDAFELERQLAGAPDDIEKAHTSDLDCDRSTPLVSPGELTFLQWQPRVDASKAQRELGFVPTPIGEGFAKTIAFLRHR
jgi:nucleoside-diphosphate-sugar epimerase